MNSILLKRNPVLLKPCRYFKRFEIVLVILEYVVAPFCAQPCSVLEITTKWYARHNDVTQIYIYLRSFSIKDNWFSNFYI